MFTFARIVHLLALGLWLGSVVTFTLVGLSLFDTFDKLTTREHTQRPMWLPAPIELDRPPPGETFPEPLRREQGSRLAGAAISPMFLWYFALQMVCGTLALLATLWFPQDAVSRLRGVVLLLALAGATSGAWLNWKVHDLHRDRNNASDIVLQSSAPEPEQVQAADAARREFGQWHGYSQMANLATIVLVIGAMILAAFVSPNVPRVDRLA